jgi:proteasome accessory factor C
VFRVDRIRDLIETSDRFDPPSTSSTPNIRYSPSVDDVTARIALTPAAAWVSDYYPVGIVSEGPDGKVIDFSATDPMVTARLLLRLGDNASLVSGPEVSAATGSLRMRIAARYR